MRTAVLADIHANMAALEAVFTDLRTEKIADVVTLGDNIGYGPDPDEVTQELVKLDVTAVQGNHEYALLNPSYYFRMNPVAQSSLDITRTLLSENSMTYALQLKQVKIHHGARLVHGCPPKSQTAYLFSPAPKMLDQLFRSFPEAICFYGHTHIMSFFAEGKIPDKGYNVASSTLHLEDGRKYIINPGSVGQPRDRHNNLAKYIIWDREQKTITFREVEYDIMKTVNKLNRLGFPPSNAARLLR